MNYYPRVLYVDTTYAPTENRNTEAWSETIDYHVYDNMSPHWRKIEEALRVDFHLARKSKSLASDFDVVFAGSERVAIPLAAVGVNRPMVALVHHMASPRKRRLYKYLNLHKRWARIGCLSDADLEYMRDYYGYPAERLFKYIAAPLSQIDAVTREASTGPIISVGVSHRDYSTLFDALRRLPHCRTVVYGTSRYEPHFGALPNELPSGVELAEEITFNDLILRYQAARFVVLPLHDTTQFSAGCTAALEAAAAGRAIVATDTPGMREYIQDGETGLLVPPYDVDAMHSAIERLWNEPETALRMGCLAREHVEQNYNPYISRENLRHALLDAWREIQT